MVFSRIGLPEISPSFILDISQTSIFMVFLWFSPEFMI
jgi:hypothetical protein